MHVRRFLHDSTLNISADTISPTILISILETPLIFLSSASRQIAQLILGFVNVAIYILQLDLLHTHLPAIEPGQFKWLDYHNNLGVRLKMDDGEPMSMLAGAATRVTTRCPVSRHTALTDCFCTRCEIESLQAGARCGAL